MAEPGRQGRHGRGATIGYALLLAVLLAFRAGGPGAGEARAQARHQSRVSADRSVMRTIEGENVLCLYGNVWIDRDTITAAADTAFHYRDRNIFRMWGHVVLTRFGTRLTCDQADYDEPRRAGDFYGNVRFEEDGTIGTGRRAESRQADRIMRLIGDALLVSPDYTVRGDTIFRDRLTGIGEAFGNVRIIQPGGTNLVTGEHAVFTETDSTVVVDVDPVFTSREQSGGTLTSRAELMRFLNAEDRVVMIDSVRIHQGRMRATADTAVVLGREHLVLTGSPIVSQDGTSTMTGDRIEFFYLGGELREVVITGTGRIEDAAPDSLAAVYRGLPPMDVLEGDSITIEFENEEIARSVLIGNASSQYTPLDLDEEVATNAVTGDTIVINFRDDQVRRVEVMGNADGQYRFARISTMLDVLKGSRRLADRLTLAGADTAGLAETAGDAELSAGVPAGVDTLLAAALDSLASAGFDTSQSALDFEGNAETVDYSGRSVTFEMADRTMDIEGDGRLVYGTLKLDAQQIMLDTDERELYADGQPLVEDSETIAGERMGYNFRHKSAAVEGGVTTFDNYYYVGDKIKRFDDQTMKIKGGRMTSCDLEDPHYHFWSNNMKMRPDDKVVAAPVVMRVGHMPVFALPFYYKSLKSGRQSGILFPSFDFGWSSREGRYIRDFGYYWATNDYMDFIFEGDYNESSDLGFRIQNRYVKRYSFNGGVDWSRKIGLRETNDTNEWQLRWNHNQPTLFDDYQFRADVKLASTTLTGNDLTGANDRDIVSGQLNSNVFVSRNFDWASTSVSASRREFTNAEDETDPTSNNQIYTMTLPSASLRFRNVTLAPQLKAGQKGNFFGNVLRKTDFSHDYALNTDYVGKELVDETRYNARANWGLTVRPDRIGFLNLSFSANAGQAWKRVEFDGRTWVPDTNLTAGGYFVDADSVFEDTTPSLGFRTGANTALYGIFPVSVGRLQAVRHTLRLDAGWSVSPAIPGRQDYRTSYSFSMGNRFDLKYLSAVDDSTLQEKKLDGVLDWNLNTGFNPKREKGDQWDPISSSLTVKPGQSRYLKLQVSNSIDPYTLALMSTRFTYNLSFRGRLDVGEVAAVEEAPRSEALDRLGIDLTAQADTLGQAEGIDPELAREMEYEQDLLFDGEQSSFNDMYNRPGRQEGPGQKDPTEGGRYIPFDVNAGVNYRYNNANRSTDASANISLNTNVTRNWEFRYTAQFDLVSGAAIRQQYSLHRDLHCWRFEFNRTISNLDSQFGFRIYLKSIPALKFARGREDAMGNLSGGLGGSPF